MPYTPSDEIARMKRNPIGSGASAMSIVPHFESHGAPYGITAQVSSAGMNDDHRREDEQRHVRLARVRLFLHDVLHAVGDGLQQPVRSDAVRAAAILDERADAPLEPDDHHHADHVDRERDEHLHDRGEEPDAAVRRLRQVLERRLRRAAAAV